MRHSLYLWSLQNSGLASIPSGHVCVDGPVRCFPSTSWIGTIRNWADARSNWTHMDGASRISLYPRCWTIRSKCLWVTWQFACWSLFPGSLARTFVAGFVWYLGKFTSDISCALLSWPLHRICMDCSKRSIIIMVLWNSVASTYLPHNTSAHYTSRSYKKISLITYFSLGSSRSHSLPFMQTYWLGSYS